MSPRRHKVIIAEHLDAAAATWLGERATLIHMNSDNPAALREALHDAAALVVRTYTQVDDDLLQAAPQLKVVGRAGVGLDNIDLDACRRRSIRVVYTPEANTQAVVEYVFGLILDALRPRLYLTGATDPEVFHRHRAQLCAQRQLDELTLGILGMGRIGRRVAQVARVIGMPVIFNDLLSTAELHLPDGLDATAVTRSRLYYEADVLTLHVDGRPSNVGLISNDVLNQLKPTCLVINTARGNIVDSEALAAWARRVSDSGGGAILDVHDPEPPPADYPLLGLPNVRILPHLASRTATAMANMSWVVRDVDRVLRGEEPQWAAI